MTHPEPRGALVDRRLYETMVLVRVFEPGAERQYKRDNIGGCCHLSMGQEAGCSAPALPATFAGAVGKMPAVRRDELLDAGGPP
jgi:hypothetical protein